MALCKIFKNIKLVNYQRYCTAIQVTKQSRESSDLPDVLESSNRDIVSIENVPTYFSPTFNFASYINKSPTLQRFVELGVDLSKIEKKKGLPQFILKLNFDRDVKDHLLFLHDLELPAEYYGEFLTKNPLFFKNSLDDLETRVYYLRSKNFSVEQVRTIVAKDPFWLNFSTKRIDKRLGWFQTNFALSGDDIRFLATRYPKVITSHLMTVREIAFSVKEEMGFDKDGTKILLLALPKIFMMRRDSLVERFGYIHNVMKFSHDKILQTPQILNTRLSRLEIRYKFLKLLKRDQFDEKLPRYVSLKDIYSGTDEEFATNVCESTIETFDNFLKTL